MNDMRFIVKYTTVQMLKLHGQVPCYKRAQRSPCLLLSEVEYMNDMSCQVCLR